MRVYELAKELGVDNKVLIEKLQSLGVDVKSHSSSVEEADADVARKALGAGAEKKPAAKKETPAKKEEAAAPAESAAPAAEGAGQKKVVKKIVKRVVKKVVVKKDGETSAPAAGSAEAPKKKKIIQVFRSQNANTKEGRDYSRRTGADERGTGGRPVSPVRPAKKPLVKVPRPQPVFKESAKTIEERKAALEEATRRREEAKAAELEAARAAEEAAKTALREAEEAAKKAEEEAKKAAEAAKKAEEAPKAEAPKAPRQEKIITTGRAAGGRGGVAGRNDRQRPGTQQPAAGATPAKKGGRDARGKDKEKAKDDRRGESRFSDRKRGGKDVPSQLPKALQKPVHRPKEEKKEEIKEITLPEKLTIRELADKMKIQPSAIVKKLFLEGMMVTVNQEIDFEKAQEIALEYDIIAEPEEKVDVIAELLAENEEENEKDLVNRAPVVCVMGHVDHGKTSLLDKIRDTRVTDREAGGITQHIGAYKVEVNGREITFLDTPGHEAFTAMRMRGANSTDIAVLVVAADDGVMPQTVEAINHAKAAGVEVIVAVNKIDKDGANVDRVKQELSEHELLSEDWGGSTVFAPVSAKTGEGIDNLLEMILLTADILELKANPKRKARGLVLEAKLDKGKGPVANVLVQKGTLHVGDFIACGAASGKVRALMDEHGRNIQEAGPSTPVEILGLSDVPNAGEILVALDSDKEAKDFAATFISEGRNKLLEETRSRMSLDDLFSQIHEGDLQELNLVVKADVQGSVEAVKQSLQKLSNEEVAVKVVHSGAGAINESDIQLAAASNAIVIGFNVRADATAKAIADQEKVDIRLYKVIYQAIEDIENAMKGMLAPVYEERVIGHAEVRQLFKASGVGTIAGSYVTDGVIHRGCKVRIRRGEEQIFEGDLASLKRFKDDVKEVRSGYECGLVFDGFSEVQELDQVEAYEMVEVPRS